MPPAAAPAASFGSSVLFPLQIVWVLHRRAVLAGTPRRWGCVSRSGVQPGARFSSGVPGSGCGMERPRPFPSAAERGWRSGSGSGTAERCRGTAGFILFYFKSPFPGVFGAVGAWPGGLSSLCVPAAHPRCPGPCAPAAPSASLRPRSLPRAITEKIEESLGKSDTGPSVSSPRLSLLFSRSLPAAGSIPSTGERPGGPGRRRMRHLGVSLWMGEEGRVTPKISPVSLSCPFPSQPCSSSVSLEHLILIIRGIQPSNCDWEGEIKATPQIQVLSAASPRKNRGS